MVLSVHTMEMEYLHKRQRDIFEAMCIPFLDFFMRDICRSLEEILASDLKLHGEMVEGRAMERPEQPLPNDVYSSICELLSILRSVQTGQFQTSAPAIINS